MLFWGGFTTGEMFDVFASFQSGGISSLHNDFLLLFIELGFFGFIAWMASYTLLRVKYFSRGGNMRRAVTTACLLLYMVIISMTDNTLHYPLIYMTTGVLTMGVGFDEEVRAEEIRLFGRSESALRGMSR